jgi:putative hydrolase of the HAD superfamily
MSEVTAVFWDIGGVLLTNGWDRYARAEAVRHFGIEAGEFEQQHQAAVDDLETGRITLDGYLDRVVFDRPRGFRREDFKAFMFAQSHPLEAGLDLARSVGRSRRYFVSAFSNESRELNDYRIERFGLREIFDVFISSCYVGIRKPDEAIYRLALDLTQKPPAECLFIDDREENLAPARALGAATIHHDGDVPHLRAALASHGVVP